jgi:predicted DNA-binding transcriptional regulator AlpA
MPTNQPDAIASDDVLLKPEEAAKFLKISVSWLAKARMNGNGPPFVRVGRSIRYSRSALIRWMTTHQCTRTSQ